MRIQRHKKNQSKIKKLKNQYKRCAKSAEGKIWNQVFFFKVLAHQLSQPAVSRDISLVHFVNNEIVCSESGWVQVASENRDMQGIRKKSFFNKPILVPARGNYSHCGYWRDEREGGCPSFHFKSLSIIHPSLVHPLLTWHHQPTFLSAVRGPGKLSFILFPATK